MKIDYFSHLVVVELEEEGIEAGVCINPDALID